MRKLIIGAFVAGAALAGGYAVAQIVSAFPFQLQNSTLADATQVMANFNTLLSGVNANAAKNGANSDITSLLGLTTPLAPSAGGTTTWTGGTSTGAANVQVVATVVPATFTLAVGTRVVFVAGFSNTTSMTLNVSGSGAKSVYRLTQLGVKSLAGKEIQPGQVVEVIYNGTGYQLLNYSAYIGSTISYTGTAADGPYLMADGSCVSQTTYADLFSVLGTSWGTCGAGAFALPDYRGRGDAGPDGGANRITNAASGCTAVLAAGCGLNGPAQTLAQTNMANYTIAAADTLSVTGAISIASGQAVTLTGGGVIAASDLNSSGGIGSPHSYSLGSGVVHSAISSGGSGTAFSVLNPVLIVNKLIAY